VLRAEGWGLRAKTVRGAGSGKARSSTRDAYEHVDEGPGTRNEARGTAIDRATARESGAQRFGVGYGHGLGVGYDIGLIIAVGLGIGIGHRGPCTPCSEVTLFRSRAGPLDHWQTRRAANGATG